MVDRAEYNDVVYLDYNATSPLRLEAREAMWEALSEVGNASSVHGFGLRALAKVEMARQQLADLLSCTPGEIIFTSCATEANNLALRAGFARGGVLVTSAVEHPAVLDVAREITGGDQSRLVVLGVDHDGVVDLEPLYEACYDRNVALVSVMMANNETGVLTDLEPIAEAAHHVGALVHTDATQLVGRLPLNLDEVQVDLLSLSGHKFGGPQGIGALFVRRGSELPFRPLLVGGGQERGWRGGTLNVPGIVGLGAAAEVSRLNMAHESTRIRKLRDALESHLKRNVPGCRINGAAAPRLPGVVSASFPGVPADAILAAMPDIAASDGSACSSGALSPSHVLLAMGRTREEADSTVRFSLGHFTTEHEVERAAAAVIRAVGDVRSLMAATAMAT